MHPWRFIQKNTIEMCKYKALQTRDCNWKNPMPATNRQRCLLFNNDAELNDRFKKYISFHVSRIYLASRHKATPLANWARFDVGP